MRLSKELRCAWRRLLKRCQIRGLVNSIQKRVKFRRPKCVLASRTIYAFGNPKCNSNLDSNLVWKAAQS